MVKIIWTEPALSYLDEIADYIAIDDSQAAKNFVSKVFEKVELLEKHPNLGSIPTEINPIKVYRQLVVSPCRIFYRVKRSEIYIVYVMRGERILKRKMLTRFLK